MSSETSSSASSIPSITHPNNKTSNKMCTWSQPHHPICGHPVGPVRFSCAKVDCTETQGTPEEPVKRTSLDKVTPCHYHECPYWAKGPWWACCMCLWWNRETMVCFYCHHGLCWTCKKVE